MGAPKNMPKDCGESCRRERPHDLRSIVGSGPAGADTTAVLQELVSRPEGLSQAEADARLKQVGPNEIAREKAPIRP